MPTFPRAEVRTEQGHVMTTHHLRPPRPPHSRTLRGDQDHGANMLQLPLARPETHGWRLHWVLHKLCTHQGDAPQTLWPPQTAANPWPALGVNLNGFHRTATHVGRIHSDPGNHGQTN